MTRKQPAALPLVVRSLAECQLGRVAEAPQVFVEASALIPAELSTLDSDGYGGPLPVVEGIVFRDWAEQPKKIEWMAASSALVAAARFSGRP